jgi:hypothetical protein
METVKFLESRWLNIGLENVMFGQTVTICDFGRFHGRCTNHRSQILLEVSLCVVMKILGQEFLSDRFHFTVCKSSHSKITQIYIHSV